MTIDRIPALATCAVCVNGLTILDVDRVASTVTIAGRRFPAAVLICPPHPDDEDLSELQHALGMATAPGDHSVYIPAENGVLFGVEEFSSDGRIGLELALNARACKLVRQTDESMWLPRNVGLFDGQLVPDRSNFWHWAEPDWVVETIDRLSRKSFEQPHGPQVKVVPLSYFDQ